MGMDERRTAGHEDGSAPGVEPESGGVAHGTRDRQEQQDRRRFAWRAVEREADDQARSRPSVVGSVAGAAGGAGSTRAAAASDEPGAGADGHEESHSRSAAS